MISRKKLWITFAAIIVLAVLAGIIDWPKGPDMKFNIIGKEVDKPLKVHLGLDLQGGTQLIYEADLSGIAEDEQEDSMTGVRDVIERRVNALGVSEPVVQTNRVGDHWRVMVELPGVTDINEAVKEIGETPSLDFREQPEMEVPVEEGEVEEVKEEEKKEGGENEGGSADVIEEQTDLEIEEARDKTVKKKKAKKAEGDEEPDIEQLINPDELQVVGEGDDVQILDKEGNSIDMDKLSEQLQQEKQGLEGYGAWEMTELTGRHLKKAQLQFDQQTNEPIIALEFDNEGKKLFADVTERNVGKPLAIFLDGEMISAPVVNERIGEGQAVISGQFTIDEAKQLAIRLNAGALPVPIKLVSQTNVGATLGRTSVQRSFIAGILGLTLVAIFMIVFYRLPGVISVIALFIYALLVLALFKLIPVTLTLAGVAGFILSIGMAVDANVLIFGRIREELRAGKSLTVAIDDGFKHAWVSIRDSNVSTLLTCFILAWFGTSIIKGFAITLGIGVLVSMFSAIVITKTLLLLLAMPWVKKRPWLFNVK